MVMKKIKIIIFLLLFYPVFLNAQDELNKETSRYFSQYAHNHDVVASSLILLKLDNNIILDKLSLCVNDTLTEKRYATYQLINYIGQKAVVEQLRKQAIKLLIQGLNDRDGGIIYININALTTYKKSDFDAELKYMLSQKVQQPVQHYALLIKICGWLDIRDLIYEFRQKIADKGKTTSRDRWAMRLAMARMGEPDMIDYCLQKAEAAPLNDDVVYDLVPDLVYTRQKQLFNYLFKIIERDDASCGSPNPDSDEHIICAYRVIEKIAPVIVEYPLKTDKTGDLINNNADEILLIARKWIKDISATDYELDNNSF
jgi:hypothetical protein